MISHKALSSNAHPPRRHIRICRARRAEAQAEHERPFSRGWQGNSTKDSSPNDASALPGLQPVKRSLCSCSILRTPRLPQSDQDTHNVLPGEDDPKTQDAASCEAIHEGSRQDLIGVCRCRTFQVLRARYHLRGQGG
jgi:hypothetical protein